MTANTDPVFALAPNVGQAVLSVANANRDGTGTLVDLFTAGANGSRVDKVVHKATAATTAGVIRIYLKLASGTARLLTEVPVLAATPSASSAAWEQVTDFLGGLVLPTGAKLQAAPNNAEGFVVTAFGGDF